MKIFCNLEWIVYKIIFLQEAWIQQGEKLSSLPWAVAAFEMKLPIIAWRTTEKIEAGLWKLVTEI